MTDSPTKRAPLEHTRVLDLTTEMGTLAVRMLTGFGAEVTRVEPPGGDPAAGHRFEPDPGLCAGGFHSALRQQLQQILQSLQRQLPARRHLHGGDDPAGGDALSAFALRSS